MGGCFRLARSNRPRHSDAMTSGTVQTPAGRADFAHIEVWVFDLDNTLYPAHYDLFRQVDRRIGAFVERALGIGPDEASAVRRDFINSYGSTLRGMMEWHDADADAFLGYVHDIDVESVPPSTALNEALGRLHGRKLVFTSATAAYASRVMNRLGVNHHFEDVFDIRAARLLPKLHPGTYQRFIERHRVEPTVAVMVEDIARNLAPAAALGMTTVWIPSDLPYSREGAELGHIHHVVDDLVGWLQGLTAPATAPAASDG